MPDGQVVFEITGDNRPIEDVMQDTTRMIEREGRQWDHAAEESSESIGERFVNMFKKITTAAAVAKVGKVLTGWAMDAINAASDLEEVQNVVDVTFENSAGVINSWAKNAIAQFGLTETQAKQFTSTIGAMMKSAGLAGPEIVQMSTDLAGLAADMASFYNMDYETAFAKIRSGISGETEPLKQLGINMSVANMEAFAMTQGITKAFDKMSQSEQTMLRYQYLMQATADAQGDFARTSDGYANGLRLLQNNLEQLKTNVGSVLLPLASSAINWVNQIFEAFNKPVPRTVLDDFSDIEEETSQKIAQINAKASEAEALISLLENMAGRSMTAEGLTAFVGTLEEQFDRMNEAVKLAQEGDYAGTIAAVAQALSEDLGGDPAQWADLLGAIGDKLPDANAAAKEGGATTDFLSAAGKAAEELGGDAPGMWQSLVNTLGSDAAEKMVAAFAEGATGAQALKDFATGANSLKSESKKTWEDFLNAVSSADGLTTIFSGSGVGDAAKNISDLAEALSASDVNGDKAGAWNTLLSALSENADAVSSLTGKNVEDTKEWLSGLAEAANELNPEDANGWETLFRTLIGGLPGLGDTEEGQTFLENMDKIGGVYDSYGEYLEAVGIETEGITDRQGAWLAVVQQLTKSIPGLSSLINQETGEVRGGSDALRQYVQNMKEAETTAARIQAGEKKLKALDDTLGKLYELETDVAVARARLELEQKRAYDAAIADGKYEWMASTAANAAGAMYAIALAKAEEAYDTQKEAYDEALKEREAIVAVLDADRAEYERLAHAGDEAAEAAVAWSAETQQAAAEVYNSLADAANEVDAYISKIREATAREVEQTVKGFERLQTAEERWQEAMNEINDLESQITADNQKEINIKITGKQEALATVNNLSAALDSQMRYMEEYLHNLSTAKEKGASNELLAFLSDGSQESSMYLHALATASETEVEALSQMYKEAQALKGTFTDTLTESKLNADAEFADLLTKTNGLIEQLNQYDAAKENMGNTVQGIADGIAAHIPDVELQVTALNDALSRLQGWGRIGFGFTDGVIRLGAGVANFLIGSHANGLDYVPFDNYLAQLHEGESVLTAEEARVWRQFRYGQQTSMNSFDYNAMSGAIWDNAPSNGGSVYLDGQIVGRIISTQQAASYRALERSGWRR